MKKIKNIVVGCGLSGVVIAERIANILNEEVLIIEKRNHIAGNIYDFNQNGITVHKYGPHVFHTNIKKVWDYVNKFTKFYPFILKVHAFVDGQNIPVPFNFNSMDMVFPRFIVHKIQNKLLNKYGYNVKISILDLKNETDKDLFFLSEYIYKNIFEGYTVKQWGIKPEQINPNVISRVPVFIGRDDRYFHDTYQGVPINGYTDMVQSMLNSNKISVQLNTDYHDIKNDINPERIFYTGSIDDFFNYEEGILPYRSLKFDIIQRPYSKEQKTATINYPTNFDWTRICEHRHFLNQLQNHTILSYEYPETFEIEKNERYYPIENNINKILYLKYFEKTKKLKNTFFLGRLGDYKYYNMDQCIHRALNLVSSITQNY